MTGKTQRERGVVYVASKHDRYVEQAFLSAESVKRRYPDLPVMLFTDLPRHPLCRLGRFDAVDTLEGTTGLASAWAEGQLNRLRCLSRTPFRCTLHLDTDTRVLSEELPALFALLDGDCDLGLVETVPDASYSRRHFASPMYSAGFVLYRRDERVREWLREWEAVSERNFRRAGETPLPRVAILDHVAAEDVRRRLLFMDQTSLVEILSPQGDNRFGLSVRTLDYAWNHSGSRLPNNNRALPKVLHTPALKAMAHPDLLALAFACKQEGRTEEAGALYGYLASKYPDTPPLLPSRVLNTTG